MFQLERTRDLAKLILNHSDAPKSWKSAPSPTFLSGHMGKLCLRLFKPCPNGVLSSNRLKDSLEKLQKEKGRLNQTKKTDSDFFDQVGQCVRISASQFRELKLSSSKYATFMRKASEAEKTSVDAVLQMLSVTKDEDSNQAAGKNEGMNGKSQSFESLPSVNESPKALEEKKGLGSKVFKRVLEKNLSEASTPEKRLRHKQSVPAQNAKSLEASPSIAIALPSSSSSITLNMVPPQLPVGGLKQDLDAKEESELKKWMQQKVEVAPKKMKTKSGKLKKKLSAHLAKQPSGNFGKKVAKCKALPKVEEDEEAVEEVDNNVKKKKKSSFKHRKTSTAYHQAVAHAKKLGFDKDARKEEGRKASQKMSADIDAGLVTEDD